jgi:acyl-CoA reductase-like NAD-dependent aldehyde dehydrogenase
MMTPLEVWPAALEYVRVVGVRVVNPFDQSTVADVAEHDTADLECALAAAHRAAAEWARVDVAERARRVAGGVDGFRAARDAIAREVSQQMGKPIREARREVDTMLDRAAYMIGIAETALAPEALDDPARPRVRRRIEHLPLGVVLDIAAWNYPLLIPVNAVVPALLAGNAVLLKHSRHTPLCGARFAAAFAAIGPPGLVQHLVIDHAQTAALLTDPRVAHAVFTGSVAGGRSVQRAAAGRFIDVGLELGGKDPAYVAADADLAHAVAGIVDGACYNAGQSCCAVERVYVHRSLYTEFLDRARAVLAEYVLGDPLDEATTLGPLCQKSALSYLEAQVAQARGAGARVLAGGARLADSTGNFFVPTLLADVGNDADVMQEESFGPILPVAPVADDDEALRCMDQTRFGLTASVWTRDVERAERFARGLQAGTVFQNRCDYLDPALPWTGMRDSGRGSTLSRYGFLHLTRRRSIHFVAAPPP